MRSASISWSACSVSTSRRGLEEVGRAWSVKTFKWEAAQQLPGAVGEGLEPGRAPSQEGSAVRQVFPGTLRMWA